MQSKDDANSSFIYSEQDRVCREWGGGAGPLPSLCGYSALCRITAHFLPGLWWLAQSSGTKTSGPFPLNWAAPLQISGTRFQGLLLLFVSGLLCPRSLPSKIEAWHKKEQSVAICSGMEGLGGHYAKWHNSDGERQMLYDIICMCNIRSTAN